MGVWSQIQNGDVCLAGVTREMVTSARGPRLQRLGVERVVVLGLAPQANVVAGRWP